MIVRGVVPLLVAALVASTTMAGVSAFAPSNLITVKPIQHKFSQKLSRVQPLCMSNQFDLTRPVFDLLALRSVRGDALIRYDALNQSEPLRIVLYGILALTCLAAPSLSEVVGYDEMGTPATAASILLAVGNAGLLVRECTRRAKQLTRIEKELNAELLPIRLPTNVLSDRPFTKAATLKDLKGLSAPPRIIAMSGTKEKLSQALKGLSILGRRLQQASVFVVVIPTDGSKASDWQLVSTRNPTWLADSYQDSVWQTYFDELLEIENGSSRPSFRWFGLNSSGRSFGSGDEEIPQWLEVLGQHLRPTQLLDESDASVLKDADVASLLDAQEKFYSALTTGNLETMTEINSNTVSPQISEVIDAGGRLDSWKDCLADGARPQDMLISGADAIFFSDNEAYTTNVEFPTNTGMDSATLLAIQRWSRGANGGDWKLELHQTIPWSPDTKAQGTLKCDCRGCVALTRSPERRTFGGMIG